MSENEIREWVWKSCADRFIAMITEYSEGWAPNGPSKAAADDDFAIVEMLAMPVPHPKAGEQ